MRKFLTTLLAASAIALPATAATTADGPRDRGQTRADRAEARADRDEARADRPQRAERATRSNDGGVQRSRPDRPQMSSQADSSSRGGEWTRRPASGGEAPAAASTWQRRDRDVPTNVRRDSARERPAGNWAGRGTTAPRGDWTQTRPDRPTGSFGTRVGTNDTPHSTWTRDWRNDRRYDWRDYRTHNRTLFRVGIYYDPYGYNYRRWNIGWSMRPYYYQSNYWISDPWQYRLPEVYGPYRWVRYYDDAILVNVYTGEVADVIYNFFW